MKQVTDSFAQNALLQNAAKELFAALLAKGMTLSSAESCTGGLIAKCMTDISGSSAVFYGACVTYTNEVKCGLLGIDEQLIAQHTEVSSACAAAMASAVRKKLGTDIGISTTGFAGPTGGTEKDPVGTVYIGISTKENTLTERFSAPKDADHSAVRALSAARAMELALESTCV